MNSSAVICPATKAALSCPMILLVSKLAYPFRSKAPASPSP
nr:MAG TPA: hypothetical protein [Caudoviricetes sp.]